MMVPQYLAMTADHPRTPSHENRVSRHIVWRPLSPDAFLAYVARHRVRASAQTSLWVALPVLWIGLLMVLVGSYRQYQYFAGIEGAWLPATARIVQTTCRDHATGTYTYDVAGTTYQRRGSLSWDEARRCDQLRPGDTISITYDPANPAQAIVGVPSSHRDNARGSMLLSLLWRHAIRRENRRDGLPNTERIGATPNASRRPKTP